MTKERPILFSGAMVRAILDGRKTQTRRVVKPQPMANVNGWDWSWPIPGKNVTPGTRDYWRNDAKNPIAPRYCPHGQPGDRLWVRETTKARPLLNMFTGEATNAICGAYVADDEPVLEERGFDLAWWYSRKTCPAIHMPRAACRLVLEVTGVRVERLNDCSEADALAEGVTATADDAFHIEHDMYRATDPVECYARLWAAINGAESWAGSPWVWVVEFRRVQCG